MYFAHIPYLEARRQSYALEAAAYPNTKAFEQKKVTKFYQRILNAGKKPTTEDVKSSWDYLRTQAKSHKKKPKV